MFCLLFYQIIYNIVEHHPRDVGPGFDGTSPVFGDESLPRLFETSRESIEQLPKQPGNPPHHIIVIHDVDHIHSCHHYYLCYQHLDHH